MARGCSDPAMSNSRPASPTSTLQECEVPTIQLQDSVCEEDDDDAAVFLQMLGPNYAITARSKSSKLSFASKESRQSSAVSSALSRQKSTRNLVDVTTRLTHSNEGQLYRLLSAKRNHIQQLSNDVSLLHNRIKELEEQNRLLLRVSKRQEAALTRYHDMKSELPHILEAHKLEINVLQEKLRRSTEENRKNTERLKTGDNRLLKLTEEATKLRELNRKRNLPERDQLNKQLIAATRTLHEKEKEVAELKRRIGILEKALKQQVQAEVGRHRATARKLYNLQCDHHELQEILKEREHELESLKQYSLSTGSGATADSACTTAPSSRSGSLSARHKRGSSSSGTTSTSGVVCPVDTLSATESRMSFVLEATGRLPPISAEARRHKDIDSLIGSPEPLPRRTRHRSHSTVKDGSEERRFGRVRRSRRVSKEEGFFNSRCTPSPSPSTTPEPHAHRSDPDGDALEDSSHCPLGNNDDRRRHRDDSHSISDQGDHEHEEKDTNGSDDNKPSLRREFSLIEHYPPRERVTLHGGSSAGGSDSGSGTSGTPPPPAPPPSKPLIDARPPPHLARTSGPGRGSLHRRNNMKAKDLRVSSSLTKLDSETSPKPVRTAITP
ncbi:uncharacterized protein LOC123515081 [Portunus trituberculatus]|uniref:uncharacterized protein LOC123515081 n=1 Tax=Portunus trituberculatus TaxID=210409 RepID=UPI001E1CEB72|nr:uncharacterized protein LOC123515081 [Portunus trituberculatus]XP_045129431.1 uncharacterized protein LOC123515081 [Portunus trituberculatus]XP_045129432.1 uncharacterized protein LOC123515081 [Portunus trituberculatus]